MEIKKNLEGEKLTIILEGRLDTVTAPNLEAELKESLNGVKELIFDFDKLDYVSSAGLRVLLTSQKTMQKQGSMKIINVCNEVNEVFEITAFNKILTIEKK
ncbi:MAG: STAS domain-containing protein [Lachnospiraceae bacterium]|nr:STAS domain-containing protein [Lachnospiraceae bacterium]